MKLVLDWHIPFPAEWDEGKKMRALEKLAEYARNGTIYETRTRMQVTSAQAIVRPNRTMFLELTLEN